MRFIKLQISGICATPMLYSIPLLILCLVGCTVKTTESKKAEMRLTKAKMQIDMLLRVCRDFFDDTGGLPHSKRQIYSVNQGGTGTNDYLTGRFDVDPWVVNDNYYPPLATIKIRQ